jgi:hypothetical protein
MRESKAPAFFLGAAIPPALPGSKQPKTHPLESITYEMLFCNSFVLTFMQNDGGPYNNCWFFFGFQKLTPNSASSEKPAPQFAGRACLSLKE